STGAAAPPMRDFAGQMAEIRLREPKGLHLLTAAMVNAGEGEAVPAPPPVPLLTLHDKATLRFLIEDHVEFYLPLADGREVPCALPRGFVEHYLSYGQHSKLPKVHAVCTLPMVLPNGELLGKENGLDRKHGVFFAIENELLKLLPSGNITNFDIEKSMRF